MLLKQIFILIFVIMSFSILISFYKLRAVEGKTAKYMRLLTFFTFFPVVFNTIGFAAPNQIVAEISFSLFFSSIDILLICLFLFMCAYTDFDMKQSVYSFVSHSIVLIDILSLCANTLFHHSFVVEQVDFKGAHYYNATDMFIAYDLHLAVCYLLCATSFLILIRKLISSPSIYKKNYYMILIPLIVVLMVDGASIAYKLPLNYSILAYSAMVVLFRYLSLVSAPKALVNNTVMLTVESMDAGIICFDMNGKYAFSNKALWKIFGLDEDRKRAEELFIERNRDFGLGDKDFFKWDEKFEVGAKIIYLGIEYSKMYDNKKRFVGSYFHMTDNTEFVKHNQELLQQVYDENEAKTNFVSRISHEIRTPLNSIYGMNEMILRDATQPQIIEYSKDIKASSDMVINIINDVLDYSRVSSGKMELVLEDYNCGDMLKHLYKMMAVSAKNKGLELEFDISQNLPAMLNGDKGRIEQILVNLISNAIKYTTAGKVKLKLAGRRNGEEINLHFAVEDTGIGIKKEDIPRLFVAYDRIEEVKHHSIQGTNWSRNKYYCSAAQINEC